MKRRHFLLLVRAAKQRKRIRVVAFWDAMAEFNGGACHITRRAVIPCKACKHLLHFGEFCKHGDWTGHGKIKTLGCPKCGCTMERKN